MGVLSNILGARSPEPARSFWLRSPIPGGDSLALRQYGLAALARHDAEAVIATGWALWDVDGLHANQSLDFLQDGYSAWRTSRGFDPRHGRHFIDQMLERLSVDPVVPDDIWGSSQQDVQPVAVHFSAKCWAASELAEYDVLPEEERRNFLIIASSPEPFVPPRSIKWARSYAQAHDLTAPWS